jgi:hypothetical protein
MGLDEGSGSGRSFGDSVPKDLEGRGCSTLMARFQGLIYQT